MKIETTIGTVISVGVALFLVGAQYGYLKTEERFKLHQLDFVW